MKLHELAEQLSISVESIKRFILDFELDLDECLTSAFEVKPEFEKFATENKDFLKTYDRDLHNKKSLEEIAEKITQPKDKIEEFLSREMPQVYDNGFYKSSVSSFGIDNKMGGNYNFVYNYFGNQTPLKKKDFIGYSDLFFSITDALEPFINEEEARNWGIQKPVGIILYGPPGSGKIFWAKKISEIIGFQFKEVKKQFLTTASPKSKLDFNDYLVKNLSQPKVELLVEDFDYLMQEKTSEYNPEAEHTKEIILNHMYKFEQEEILMVGAANTLYQIDEEVLAPGRFDVVLPIFPPNAKERAELIQYSMLKNLSKDSTLYKILEHNHADHLPFWNSIASKMKVFSNTMVIDFTQSLKKKIRAQYQKEKTEKLKIDYKLLDKALRDAAAKLTPEYLNQIQQFILDVSIYNADDFSPRLKQLTTELNTYKAIDEPHKEIGFNKN